ncbi:nitrous oxide-stimulated promoter family protein [Chloroflexota bacterium]
MRNFISIYCRENHRSSNRSILRLKDNRVRQALGNKGLVLCQDCGRLFLHSITKLLMCPYNPKPMCKKCETHCYAPGYREKIRDIMKFSGWYMIKHGRLDLILHYYF